MTRIPMRLSPLLLALVALGCKGTQENQAKDQAPPAASTTSPSEKKSARAPREYPAAEAFTRKPLAVGQWIRIAIEPKGSPPSQVFVRIVGKEGDAFWYEVEANTPSHTSLVQFLVEGAAEKGFDKNAVRKLRQKPMDGPVRETSEPREVLIAAEQVEEYVAPLNPPDFTKTERKDTKVTAGVFQGCFVYDAEFAALDVKKKATLFRHPAVPITGFVRAEGTAVGGPTYTTELLEMHETGARAVMGL
ncbi:hypothetical protein [Polyangium mundeleinium]|uniref:Uncharacterized protein n=1 Tax=Polyangium mundeleinium TaxID=2995306 RepID=A0ABT5EWP4_9BACT|nr:hypothetical protein [Polyangium mundeleinium]MDC0745623.1 hypothetical protein [Polyangium mundeleinium]